MPEPPYKATDTTIVDSSGNVFADLNLPSSGEDMFKVEISRAIAAAIRQQKLTQAQAADIVGTDQAKISSLLRGHLKEFSADRLIRYLLAFGLDMDIRLSNPGSTRRPGRIKISQAA